MIPIMTNITSLADDVDAFLQLTGMGPAYFSKKASGNGELVSRLRAGGRVWPETEARVRAFIDCYLDNYPSVSSPDGPQPTSSPAAIPDGAGDTPLGGGNHSSKHHEVTA